MKYTELVRAWVLLVYSQDSRRIILEHSLVYSYTAGIQEYNHAPEATQLTEQTVDISRLIKQLFELQ